MVRNSTKQEQKSSNGKATAHLLQLLGGGNLGSRWVHFTTRTHDEIFGITIGMENIPTLIIRMTSISKVHH